MTVDITYQKIENKDVVKEETIEKTISDFSTVVITYQNNKDVGTGYAQAVVEGFNIEIPFDIVAGKSVANKPEYESYEVTWDKVAGATGYAIYRSTTEEGKYIRIATVSGADTVSYKDKKRYVGRNYYYKVTAFRKPGTKDSTSSATAVKNAWTVPAAVSISSSTKSHYDRVILSWTKSSSASGYKIYRSTTASSGYECIKVIEGNGTLKWTDTGLDGNTRYYYKIRTYKQQLDRHIDGAYSNVYTKLLVPKNLESLINNYVGKPYLYGGNKPTGWDCSGFTQWANNYLFGKKIPRTGSAQLAGGKRISVKNRAAWKPGDIIVWYFNTGGVSHVGLYIGDNKMMHALNEKYDTLIQDVDYYNRWDGINYLGAVVRYSD